jgi:hypothetical protein
MLSRQAQALTLQGSHDRSEPLMFRRVDHPDKNKRKTNVAYIQTQDAA